MGYKDAVGPPEKWSEISGLQFKVLYDLGLRDWHTLCDVGCGSLRGGRLFIPYLLPGKYYGIEPNSQILELGLEHELGSDIMRVKKPTFYYNAQFDISRFGVKFNFILAQSIFSHTAIHQALKLLFEARQNIADNGIFVATYFVGSENNYIGETWRRSPVVTFNTKWFREQTNEAGFSFEHLNYGHPSGQQWVMMKPRGTK